MCPSIPFPELTGEPIGVEFRPAPRAYRGRVESRGPRGHQILGASFVRERRIVFDSSLGRDPVEWRRILVHELFHFVWARLGNPARRAWEQLLMGERSRGELGWSAEWRKRALGAEDLRVRNRRWREYACESFCDTAAWMFAGGDHEEFTLAKRFRRRRKEWFRSNGLTERIRV